jgi:GAF domain-containing protein
MTDASAADEGLARELAEARALAEARGQEIERLRHLVAHDRFAEDLHRALVLAAAAGTIASPLEHERLLELIVDAAADVIGARAASLFLIDDASQELVFEVALGPKASSVSGLRVPLGEGIAGLVALSGQPMAVSEAEHDARVAEEIGAQIGYVPTSILCVPLFNGERVIGVVELLDKEGDVPFTPSDMQTLGYFANIAAVAIEQSRTSRHLGPMVVQVVRTLGEVPDADVDRLTLEAASFGLDLEDEPSTREALELARLVQAIAWEGEVERRLCREILEGFVGYLRARSTPPELGEPV